MGALIIGCRRDEDFILAAGGEMAAAATARRDVMVFVCKRVLRHVMPQFRLYVSKMLHSLAFLGKCEAECG
jgi:transposase